MRYLLGMFAVILVSGYTTVNHQPIDRTLQYPHGMSVSLDHVIPLAHGGPHTYSNVQAAHLRCNREAGSRIAAGHRQLVMPRELSGPRPS